MISTQTLQEKNSQEIPEAFLLVSRKGNGWGREIGEFLTLGRNPGCQYSLSDPSVSGRHARIERKENGYFLRDLQSRNGTYLNGVKVLEAFLAEGDRIQIGKTQLKFSFSRTACEDLPELHSKNKMWARTLEQLDHLSQSDLPLLILGPSGTGKEVLAQTLHQRSFRRSSPLISVNCSALSESLIESELFGHSKGSFTGATGDRKGAFEAARGGTLFLDEVGDLPLSLQPKLLRALENKEIRPVGKDENIRTDVRILAATHHNLREKVLRGDFRLDLYYRLNVLQIKVPALKERPEDIDDLLHFFCRKFGISFSISAKDILKKYDWPGNVRELKNLVAKAKTLYGAEVLSEDQVYPLLDILHTSEEDPGIPSGGKEVFSGRVLKELEYELIKKRLAANGGNQRQTALDLGIPKSTLHDRIRAYKIKLPPGRPRVLK
jgi:transcriptional regulator with GAF, ATPase, and Fis domain